LLPLLGVGGYAGIAKKNHSLSLEKQAIKALNWGVKSLLCELEGDVSGILL